jgi:hypothetical protein
LKKKEKEKSKWCQGGRTTKEKVISARGYVTFQSTCWLLEPVFFFFLLHCSHLIAHTHTHHTDYFNEKGPVLCVCEFHCHPKVKLRHNCDCVFHKILDPSSIMDDGNGQVTFMFQVGLVRDFISTDASQLTLKTLKDLACNFINQRVSVFEHYTPIRLPPRSCITIHLTTPLL